MLRRGLRGAGRRGLPLDLLQVERQMARLRFQPSLAEQNAMNYEQVRVDLLRTKSEQAIAKVNLERAQNEVQRNTPLDHDKPPSSRTTHSGFSD
jgi:hypothetical protein